MVIRCLAPCRAAGCATLAHSTQVEIGHACASKPLLASYGIAQHSCLGVQLCNAESSKRQQTPGNPAWTVVLHPTPLLAEQQAHPQAQAPDQQQIHLQGAGHLPQPTSGALGPAQEHPEPQQLLQTWVEHQVKIAMSRPSESPNADGQHQSLSSSMGVLLGSGTIVAASCCPAQSGAQSSVLDAPQQPHEPSSCLHPSVNQDAMETTAVKTCQHSSQLCFRVELVKGRLKGPHAQPQPPSQATQQAATAGLDTASSFRPTLSGQQEPSETRPRLEAFVEVGHVQSKQIEVRYGSPSGQQNTSRHQAGGSQQSDHSTLPQAPGLKGQVGAQQTDAITGKCHPNMLASGSVCTTQVKASEACWMQYPIAWLQ